MTTPEEVNAVHALSDVDGGPLAQHHTLGIGNTQATPGDHNHSGGARGALLDADHLFYGPNTADGSLLGVLGAPDGAVVAFSGNAGEHYHLDPASGSGGHFAAPPGALAPVRAVSTANVNVANPGAVTQDGVTWAAGDRILLAAQSTASQNGPYDHNGTGVPMSRARDADLAQTLLPGVLIPVAEGTLYAGSTWQLLTAGPIVLGTTGLTFARTDRRIGCRVRRAASQAVTTAVNTTVSFDTEDHDSDGFFAPTSTTVTIPAGLDGLYAITFNVASAGTGSNITRAIMQIVPTSGIAGMPAQLRTAVEVGQTSFFGVCSATIPLLAGDSFVCQVLYVGPASPLNITAWLSCYRIAPW